MCDNEFVQFINTLKRLGIAFEIDWSPNKKDWQRVIRNAGYNITALGCIVVSSGDRDYLFSTGQIEWTDDERGIGPGGLLLLMRDSKTKKVEPRRLYVEDTLHQSQHFSPKITGLAAIKAQYAGEFIR